VVGCGPAARHGLIFHIGIGPVGPWTMHGPWLPGARPPGRSLIQSLSGQADIAQTATQSYILLQWNSIPY